MEKPAKRNRRPVWMLFVGMISTITLGYLVWTYAPTSSFPAPLPAVLNPLFVFFILVFFSISLLTAYILKHSRRGILLGLFVCSYLLLRLNHLTEVYFALILLALFVSLELFFTRYH